LARKNFSTNGGRGKKTHEFGNIYHEGGKKKGMRLLKCLLAVKAACGTKRCLEKAACGKKVAVTPISSHLRREECWLIAASGIF
jgi:hypothetical protein